MKRILITGASGQIGSELTPALRARYGRDAVLAVGHRRQPDPVLAAAGSFVFLDIRDRQALSELVRRHAIDTVYHLAALLSATAEEDPLRAWRVNVDGLINVLETAREHACAVFVPSSVGVFGPGTPHSRAPQDTLQRPGSIYGVTKVAGELLCDYYGTRYGVDTRGVRFPGLISHVTPAGGGTTDYAVEIFYAALTERRYTCFLKADTRLPMMYMPDALQAAVRLMEAPAARLRHRNAFNLAAMSFTPSELAAEIRRHVPNFEMTYRVDPVRQAIADSWPMDMDDRAAREEWGWRPEYDLAAMTADMLTRLAARLQVAPCEEGGGHALG